MIRWLTVVLVLAALSCGSFAQTPKLEPGTANPALPIVAFDFVLHGATPPHYAIAVEPDGKATYRADEAPAADSAPLQPYLAQFVVSQPTRQRIFELTRALKCFKGNYEYHGGRIANMGAKKLKCTYADRETLTEFNYTTNPQMQQLVTIFQNIGNTLEFGRRLAYLYRFDRLGLDAELRAMEDAARNNRLQEVQAVAPQLERIFDDAGVMNISRRRAEHLLQLVKSNPAARAAIPQ